MRMPQKTGWIVISIVTTLCLAGGPAGATSVAHQDLVDLIHLSEVILAGRVTSVTDGFQAGVPYTEVTVAVDETFRGQVGATYTFRQFGLLKPRDLGNGLTYVGISPDGWPRFEAGEDVLLFLYKAGSLTGLRTTVGLMQGAFREVDGNYENGIGNRGTFSRVKAGSGLLTPAESKLLATRQGPVPAETLLSVVRKAVHGQWVERGKLQHVR